MLPELSGRERQAIVTIKFASAPTQPLPHLKYHLLHSKPFHTRREGVSELESHCDLHRVASSRLTFVFQVPTKNTRQQVWSSKWLYMKDLDCATQHPGMKPQTYPG